MRLKRRRHRTTLLWTFGVFVTLAIVLSSYIAVVRWLGWGPFGAHVAGQVVSKSIVTYQGRATRVDYMVHIRTKTGSIEDVAVPERIYRNIGVGWHLECRASAVTATSPEAGHAVVTATQY
jgi:hypothetical protein